VARDAQVCCSSSWSSGQLSPTRSSTCQVSTPGPSPDLSSATQYLILDKHPLVRPSLEAMCGTGARTLAGSNAPMRACMTSFFGLLPSVPISSCNYIISSPARPAGAAEWQRCRQAPPPAVATLGSKAVLEDWVRSGDFGTTLHRRSASPTKAKVSFAPVYFGLLMLCCFFTFSGRLRKRIGEPSSPGWIRPGV
jgi:hypothetical protein